MESSEARGALVETPRAMQMTTLGARKLLGALLTDSAGVSHSAGMHADRYALPFISLDPWLERPGQKLSVHRIRA
jgi:hypothetical protein